MSHEDCNLILSLRSPRLCQEGGAPRKLNVVSVKAPSTSAGCGSASWHLASLRK